jgi:hypothetical protein
MRVSRPQSVGDWRGIESAPLAAGSNVGLAMSTLERRPVHARQHLPQGSTNGWYIWCSEDLSDDADFFSPLHIEHLAQYVPDLIEYPDLPPGYRLLIDGAGYEDVWFDAKLLST